MNGELTNPIQIHRGTRQGCPLSPLLFITMIEILTRSISGNLKIRGLRTWGQEFKLITFADNLAIILKDPLESIDPLKSELDGYSKVSGLKINYDKTMLLTKNMNSINIDKLVKKAPIQATSKIKYLEIHLTNRTSTIYKDNYEKLLKEIENLEFLE